MKALKACRLRVPEGASPAAAELADEALGTVVAIMRGEVSALEATHRLKAATHIRLEVCGPPTLRHEVSGPEGAPVSISIVRTVKE